MIEPTMTFIESSFWNSGERVSSLQLRMNLILLYALTVQSLNQDGIRLEQENEN